MPMKMIFSLKVGVELTREGGSKELHETSLELQQECHTKMLSGSATIKGTVKDCQTEV